MTVKQELIYNLLISKCEEGKSAEVINAFLDWHSTDLIDDGFIEYLDNEGIIEKQEYYEVLGDEEFSL